MNPTQISPNTGRTFEPGAKYWLREADKMVMPRSNSPYEQPEGFVAVIASSETELTYDNGQLDVLPTHVDPSDPSTVGSAVSYNAHIRHESKGGTEGRAQRSMPVTLPNAQDDHVTRERSLAAFAEAQASGALTAVVDPASDDGAVQNPNLQPRLTGQPGA